MLQYYLGRQPIFDADTRLFGYELLYRAFAEATQAGPVDGERATSNVLINSFIEMGLARVVGDHRAFVNVTRNFLLNEDRLPPPSDQLVLEILEGIEVNDELIQAITRLKAKGYLLALDDFLLTGSNETLLAHADIVKLDIQGLEKSEVHRHLEHLRHYPVKCLAEKVETPDEFDWCKGLGFDYFQGYFLCRPRVISGHRLPTNRLNAIRMVAKLHDPEVDYNELEHIIGQDLTLSYKLLKYINSAAFTRRNEIESIRHAIVVLGEREIRRWASLIALSEADDKPGELIMTSLTRSKMCELLTDQLGKGSPRTAFMIGLLSTIDAMMDMPLGQLIDPLPLAPEAREALLQHRGKYFDALACTLAYERGDWEHASCPGLTPEMIADVYLKAVDWAEVTIHALGDRR